MSASVREKNAILGSLADKLNLDHSAVQSMDARASNVFSGFASNPSLDWVVENKEGILAGIGVGMTAYSASVLAALSSGVTLKVAVGALIASVAGTAAATTTACVVFVVAVIALTAYLIKNYTIPWVEKQLDQITSFSIF